MMKTTAECTTTSPLYYSEESTSVPSIPSHASLLSLSSSYLLSTFRLWHASGHLDVLGSFFASGTGHRMLGFHFCLYSITSSTEQIRRHVLRETVHPLLTPAIHYLKNADLTLCGPLLTTDEAALS